MPKTRRYYDPAWARGAEAKLEWAANSPFARGADAVLNAFPHAAEGAIVGGPKEAWRAMTHPAQVGDEMHAAEQKLGLEQSSNPFIRAAGDMGFETILSIPQFMIPGLGELSLLSRAARTAGRAGQATARAAAGPVGKAVNAAGKGFDAAAKAAHPTIQWVTGKAAAAAQRTVKPKDLTDLLRSTITPKEREWHSSIESAMDPNPYGGFDDAMRQIPENIQQKFQAHGLLAGSPHSDLSELLIKGIGPHREFHAGPVTPGSHGVDTTRTTGPYVLLSDPGKTMKETGVKNIVLNRAAESAITALRKQFPDRNFMTQQEAVEWMKTGKAPKGPTVSARPAKTAFEPPSPKVRASFNKAAAKAGAFGQEAADWFVEGRDLARAFTRKGVDIIKGHQGAGRVARKIEEQNYAALIEKHRPALERADAYRNNIEGDLAQTMESLRDHVAAGRNAPPPALNSKDLEGLSYDEQFARLNAWAKGPHNGQADALRAEMVRLENALKNSESFIPEEIRTALLRRAFLEGTNEVRAKAMAAGFDPKELANAPVLNVLHRFDSNYEPTQRLYDAKDVARTQGPIFWSPQGNRKATFDLPKEGGVPETPLADRLLDRLTRGARIAEYHDTRRKILRDLGLGPSRIEAIQHAQAQVRAAMETGDAAEVRRALTYANGQRKAYDDAAKLRAETIRPGTPLSSVVKLEFLDPITSRETALDRMRAAGHDTGDVTAHTTPESLAEDLGKYKGYKQAASIAGNAQNIAAYSAARTAAEVGGVASKYQSQLAGKIGAIRQAAQKQSGRIANLGAALENHDLVRAGLRSHLPGLQESAKELQAAYVAATHLAGTAYKSGYGQEVDEWAHHIASERLDKPAGTSLSVVEREGQEPLIKGGQGGRGGYSKADINKIAVLLRKSGKKGKGATSEAEKPSLFRYQEADAPSSFRGGTFFSKTEADVAQYKAKKLGTGGDTQVYGVPQAKNPLRINQSESRFGGITQPAFLSFFGKDAELQLYKAFLDAYATGKDTKGLVQELARYHIPADEAEKLSAYAINLENPSAIMDRIVAEEARRRGYDAIESDREFFALTPTSYRAPKPAKVSSPTDADAIRVLDEATNAVGSARETVDTIARRYDMRTVGQGPENLANSMREMRDQFVKTHEDVRADLGKHPAVPGAIRRAIQAATKGDASLQGTIGKAAKPQDVSLQRALSPSQRAAQQAQEAATKTAGKAQIAVQRLAQHRAANATVKAMNIDAKAAEAARNSVEMPEVLSKRLFEDIPNYNRTVFTAFSDLQRDALFMLPFAHKMNITLLAALGPNGARVILRGIQIAGDIKRNPAAHQESIAKLQAMGAYETFAKEGERGYEHLPIIGKPLARLADAISTKPLDRYDTAMRLSLMEHLEKDGTTGFTAGGQIRDVLGDYGNRSGFVSLARHVGANFPQWGMGIVPRAMNKSLREQPNSVKALARANRIVSDDVTQPLYGADLHIGGPPNDYFDMLMAPQNFFTSPSRVGPISDVFAGRQAWKTGQFGPFLGEQALRLVPFGNIFGALGGFPYPSKAPWSLRAASAASGMSLRPKPSLKAREYQLHDLGMPWAKPIHVRGMGPFKVKQSLIGPEMRRELEWEGYFRRAVPRVAP